MSLTQRKLHAHTHTHTYALTIYDRMQKPIYYSTPSFHVNCSLFFLHSLLLRGCCHSSLIPIECWSLFLLWIHRRMKYFLSLNTFICIWLSEFTQWTETWILFSFLFLVFFFFSSTGEYVHFPFSVYRFDSLYCGTGHSSILFGNMVTDYWKVRCVVMVNLLHNVTMHIYKIHIFIRPFRIVFLLLSIFLGTKKKKTQKMYLRNWRNLQ